MLTCLTSQNKLISTPGFFIALLVTKDDRQCGHVIERLEDRITSTKVLTLMVELDQVVDIENVFWTLPVYFPIVLNFGILLICGITCLIIQRFCAQDINWKKYEPSSAIFDDVVLSEFKKNFRKKNVNYISSTYFGKMIIVISIFFAIPVFELTTYNLIVSAVVMKTDNTLC